MELLAIFKANCNISSGDLNFYFVTEDLQAGDILKIMQSYNLTLKIKVMERVTSSRKILTANIFVMNSISCSNCR